MMLQPTGEDFPMTKALFALLLCAAAAVLPLSAGELEISSSSSVAVGAPEAASPLWKMGPFSAFCYGTCSNPDPTGIEWECSWTTSAQACCASLANDPPGCTSFDGVCQGMTEIFCSF
jgi:hypothetical protein